MDDKTLKLSGTATRPVGLIIRQKDPNNLEMPFDQLGDFITPADLFYVRSHFRVPELNVDSYRLSIRGAVRRELSLSYADIRAMPSRTCVATLECAGNSRPGHTDVTGIWVSLDGGASWVQGDFLDPISRRGAAGNTIGSRRHNRAARAAGARREKSNAPSQTVTIRMSAAM